MIFSWKLLIIFLLGALPTQLYAQLRGLEQLLRPDLVVPEVAQYNPGLSTFFDIEDIQAPI